MKHFRFSLSLTFWIAGVSIASQSWIVPVSAQQGGQLTAPSLISDQPQDSAYDRHMQAGYEATSKKDYNTAKEQFQKALAEKPKDIYAQQALHNVDAYLAQNSNPFSNNWGLLLGAIALLAGLGSAFWLFFRTLSPSMGDLREVKSDPFPSPKMAPIVEPTVEPKPSLNRPEGNEDEFPIQPTTRLPSPELLDSLLADLRDTSPQKRRKAIWNLAQKADSRAMKPLVDLMIETDSQERTLILEALSQISTRTLKPMNQALAISLQDKNPQVRKNAIRDLTRIYDVMSQISQMLAYAIEDSDGEVKETAKWALSQLNLQMPARIDLTPRVPQGSVTVEQSYSESAE
jgi:hypothetical protein